MVVKQNCMFERWRWVEELRRGWKIGVATKWANIVRLMMLLLLMI